MRKCSLFIKVDACGSKMCALFPQKLQLAIDDADSLKPPYLEVAESLMCVI